MSSNLTRRERQFLDCIFAGHSYKEMAHQLGLTEHSVKTRFSVIYKKLGVASRYELMAREIARLRQLAQEGNGAD